MSDDTREKVLTAAEAVFFRYGLRRTTMEDVAREAGVSRQTIYSRFQTKDALLIAVAERMFDATQEKMEAALAAGGDLWSRVLAAFEASGLDTVRALQSSSHADELWATQTTLLKPVIERKHRRMIEAVARALEEAERSGQIRMIPGSSPAAVAEMLVSADLGFKSEGVDETTYRARLATAIEAMRQATRV